MLKKGKPNEVETKIPDVSGLATKTALTAVESRIPDLSSLVKKTNCDAKISELADHNHDKYITTPEFNTLAARVFNARLAQANFRAKTLLNCQVLIEKLLPINQNIYLLKMNLKS